MFNWNHHKGFSFFVLDETENKIPISEWHNVQDLYSSEFFILKELQDNGFAEYTINTCEVETIEILHLSDSDKQVLGLLDLYPYTMYIQSIGQLNQSSFTFKYGFYDFAPLGTQFQAIRNDAILEIEGMQYLLSVNQFLICEALDNFNSMSESERTFQNNLRCFADIKNLSPQAASLLDSYLQNENVYHPDKIKIEISFTGGIFEITPSIDNKSYQSGFLTIFDQFSSIRDIYTVSNQQGERIRIIISEEQKAELQKVKNTRRIIDRTIIDKIVEHPEEFFDGEQIDYTVFYSERVKEIGVYKPKFYPFICPYKSEWIPGIEIKDNVDGEKRIHFRTHEELYEFEVMLQTARGNAHNFIVWEGTEIPFEDADKFIYMAKRQFKNPKYPISPAGDEFVIKNFALIPEENIEAVGHSEVSGIAQPLFTYTFNKIDNLSNKIILKQHQKDGIAWLQTLLKENIGGCLLADDMGLGKTLQLLYLIEWHAQFCNNSKPYLIVAPVTLLENWENEYSKFFTSKTLPLKFLYGPNQLKRDFNTDVIELLTCKQIILTNYETLRTYQFNLCAVDYAIVVLDEAQKIKTPGTLITNVCKTLKADFKVAMTGTPVENTFVDLWCIMDFSVPGLLGNAKEFARMYQQPLAHADTNITELGESIRRKVDNFMIRRLKQDVSDDLPSKIPHQYKNQMPVPQLERYQIEIEQAKNSNQTGIERSNNILRSLLAIRDISDHPFLTDCQIESYTIDELITASAKLQSTIAILKDIQSKQEKVIVFTERKNTQRMLQKVIRDYFQISPSIINGDTPNTKRQESNTGLSRQQTIDRFQSEIGFNIIIMSQLAAGIGLNVTAANHVIHYSRHWNPAKEEQATDRAYRIGQEKDVHVYYPMAIFPDTMIGVDGKRQKSFDEVLDELLERKKKLAASTLYPTDRAEVRPDEIFDSVFGFDSVSEAKPLTKKEIDRLEPSKFEAYIAALYSKLGYNVHLTPYSNDKGVDVIAMKDGENYLIQAKHSINPIGNQAVQEVSTAKNYYEKLFNTKFNLIVISNCTFRSNAENLARTVQVKLIDRDQLEQLSAKGLVNIMDVHKQATQRMKRV